MSKWDKMDGGKLKQAALSGLLRGETPSELSLETGIPEPTIRYWRDHLFTDQQVERVRSMRNRELDHLLLEMAREGLRSQIAVFRQAQDPEWLKNHSAASLNEFQQGAYERTMGLLEAMTRASQAGAPVTEGHVPVGELPPGHPDGEPIDAEPADLSGEP
jgi:hypothetical protein